MVEGKLTTFRVSAPHYDLRLALLAAILFGMAITLMAGEMRQGMYLGALLLAWLPVLFLVKMGLDRPKVYFNGKVFLAVNGWGRKLEAVLVKDVKAVKCTFYEAEAFHQIEIHHKRNQYLRTLHFREHPGFPFRQLYVAIEVEAPQAKILVFQRPS